MEPILRTAPNASSNERSSEIADKVVVEIERIVKQEFTRARVETKRDWVRAKNAFGLFVGAYLLSGVALIYAALAYTSTLERVGLSRMMAHLSVTALLVIAAAASYYLGKWWLRKLSFVPQPEDHPTKVVRSDWEPR